MTPAHEPLDSREATSKDTPCKAQESSTPEPAQARPAYS